MNRYANVWMKSRVSTCGTHHTIDGRPLYDTHFLRVLSFRAPGLAPVHGADGAYHIRLDGSPAYAQRHKDTFGFYEGLAAVCGGNGWLHVLPDGVPAYSARHAWCGNFQGERCAVRVATGGYRHICPDGRPLYRQVYRYVGDFREGRAVVRRKDGLCVHINESGEPAHSRAYLDLDAYHKGFACARDQRGWTHIGMDGIPVYERRFATVEPFYNGQALVRTLTGEIAVIDEIGEITTQIGTVMEDSFSALSSDMTGFWRTFALATSVKLGIVEILPCDEHEVTTQLELPKENTRILLNALGEMGVVVLHNNRWQLTDKGEYLCRAHPTSLCDAAHEWSRLAKTRWNDLSDALRNGRKMRDYFSSELARSPTVTRVAHNMLASYARRDYRYLPKILPLNGIYRLIDAGGGNGETAQMIAAQHPELEIVLVDRPETLALSEIKLRTNEKIIVQTADIFRPWNLRADAVLLARVLHDWSDERALQILRNARAVLPTGGKLFVVEMLRRGNFDGALCSLHLTVVSGGRERTWEEFREMAELTGFLLLESRSLNAVPSLIIGEAV